VMSSLYGEALTTAFDAQSPRFRPAATTPPHPGTPPGSVDHPQRLPSQRLRAITRLTDTTGHERTRRDASQWAACEAGSPVRPSSGRDARSFAPTAVPTAPSPATPWMRSCTARAPSWSSWATSPRATAVTAPRPSVLARWRRTRASWSWPSDLVEQPARSTLGPDLRAEQTALCAAYKTWCQSEAAPAMPSRAFAARGWRTPTTSTTSAKAWTG
jgi:hypothetical protein